MPASDAAARKEARRARLKTIGRAIEEHRGKMSQAALAEKAGVGYNTVALLERGLTMPWPGNRRKIEAALDWDSGRLTAMYEDGAAAPPLPGEKASQDTADPVDAVAPDYPANGNLLPGVGAEQRSAAPQSVNGWVLDIAISATTVAATTVDVLQRLVPDEPEAVAAIQELGRQTQILEARIAASLPQATTETDFDQMVNVLTELRRHREHIRSAGELGG